MRKARKLMSLELHKGEEHWAVGATLVSFDFWKLVLPSFLCAVFLDVIRF